MRDGSEWGLENLITNVALRLHNYKTHSEKEKVLWSFKSSQRFAMLTGT